MKTSHVALAAFFTLYFITLYLAITNTNPTTKPDDHTSINGPTTVTGYLTLGTFPGRQYISEEAAHGEPLFVMNEYMAVTSEFTEAASPFFLFIPELNGTIWETPQSWPMKGYELGGLTDWEIIGAYTNHCKVTVRGNAFTVDRLDGTYQCIEPEFIEVYDHASLPLSVEGWHIYENRFTSMGLFSMPTHVIVEPSDYMNSTIFYRVTLSGGDSISFTAGSSQPFSLRIYGSSGGYPSEFMKNLGVVLQEFDNVTSVKREFTPVERGEYSFSFYVQYKIRSQLLVNFQAGRIDKANTP